MKMCTCIMRKNYCDRLPISVVIVTRNRPDMVAMCIDALDNHTLKPMQIIVVDASTDDSTCLLFTKRNDIEYVYFQNGNNRRPESKNIGLEKATQPIIAFIDDDSMVNNSWLEEILKPFDDLEVGCVGGGIDEPGTNWIAEEPVGRVLANGGLSQNFSPSHEIDIEVDHVKGCNMSFRCDVLRQLGGFDPHYTGDNVREETDACLGVKKLGKKVIFCPHAVVTHLRAPRDGISRSLADYRKVFYCARNHTYFLLKYFPTDFKKIWVNYITNVFQQIFYLRPNRELANRLQLVATLVFGNVIGTTTALTSRYVWKTWLKLR